MNPNKVGWTAFKFSIVAFIIPYMWISGQGLLLAAPLAEIIQIVFTSINRCDRLCHWLAGIRRGSVHLDRALFGYGRGDFTH